MRSETAASPARLRDALHGLRLYQQAARAAPPPPVPLHGHVGRVTLRDYGGVGPPVVFVPSLINPPSVLDLSEDGSLLRWLATQGVNPLLVDWGHPAPDERDLTIAGHVERYLLPLLAGMREHPALVGYCLGGTMALAAASAMPVRAVALIAAPWRFSGFTPEARDGLQQLWRQARPVADALGMLPMEVLQTSFWRLDPARTVGKFERLGRGGMPPAAVDGFIALEDWANDGPPLTYAAGHGLIHDFVTDDQTGRGIWDVAGRAVRPETLACPILDISSTTDRIVPAASALGLGRGISLGLGHVGMIVGGRAGALLWEPLAGWLRQAVR
ncbi:MAG: alpha/beta hydrolase [Sphingomonas sp.]